MIMVGKISVVGLLVMTEACRRGEGREELKNIVARENKWLKTV
jgi:hypothetical protein